MRPNKAQKEPYVAYESGYHKWHDTIFRYTDIKIMYTLSQEVKK